MSASTTMSMVEIAEAADVCAATVQRWLVRGLLPPPLPDDGPARHRSYRFDRRQVLEAVERIKGARAVLAGARK